MNEDLVTKIQENPKFQSLVQRRARFAWQLSAIMLALYFGFILIIAFVPTLLGIPIVPGAVTTVGIPLGIVLILTAFVLTGIYVRRANAVFDPEMNKILEDSK